MVSADKLILLTLHPVCGVRVGIHKILDALFSTKLCMNHLAIHDK